LWAKLLPAALNEKATKLHAQLNAHQYEDHSFVRSVVIDAFEANAKTYFNHLQSASHSDSKNYSSSLTV
jgi:hypothetical protein